MWEGCWVAGPRSEDCFPFPELRHAEGCVRHTHEQAHEVAQIYYVEERMKKRLKKPGMFASKSKTYSTQDLCLQCWKSSSNRRWLLGDCWGCRHRTRDRQTWLSLRNYSVTMGAARQSSGLTLKLGSSVSPEMSSWGANSWEAREESAWGSAE